MAIVAREPSSEQSKGVGMHSYQITKWGEPLERRDYATPEPKGSEVLLRVTACGVCHSDLHIWQGYFDLGNGKQLRIADRGMTLPFTLGHEVAGEVVAFGPDAHDVSIGDSRIVYPWIGCGQCLDCGRGDELLCTKPRVIGTWVDGGYSTHVMVPDARYLVDHEGISAELACTYACSGITAYSALKKAEIRRPEQKLLLIGAGGVGTAALLMAKAIAPGKVAIADIDAGKRQAASNTGSCDAVFDNGQADVVKQVHTWSKGGVDAAIDFVGRPETLRFGVDYLRVKGGTVVAVGLYGDSISLPTPLLPLKMMALKGSYVGTLDDLKAVVALAKSGQLQALEHSTCSLSEVNDALNSLTSGQIQGRMVLQPQA